MLDELNDLLKKYKTGKCSDDEVMKIEAFYASLDKAESNALPKIVTEKWYDFSELELELLKLKMHRGKRKRAKVWFYSGAAAIIVLSIGLISLFKYGHEKELSSFLPGKDGAILSLSSGKTIELDGNIGSYIEMEGLGQISEKDGFMKYVPSKSVSMDDTGTNKIVTPIARQYKLELVDGSKVWLNSGSSIEFPTVFKKDMRRITIHGEAYVEVKHIDSIPFIVNVNNHFTIKDIGTAFNISAYEEDKIESVTLVEGKIQIGNSILSPLEQFTRSQDGQSSYKRLEDATDEYIWTKGFLNFNGMDYSTLLRKISRWYDVHVEIVGELPNQHISGNIPNNMPLTNLLKILGNYGLDFNYRNNTLFVSGKKNIH
ncbi:MAG: hypothetical protein DI598_05090 [Pseudopedobacter saltans]|uniref:Anti-FecI sigma factor, FecR n=1 Tax=Pseudopedobacter saltans TaxID=151895 RepID=A0A2W5H4X9_9SPHI|nr:MAG: hypothetical protein DI598_05090 [Pseudopedobacter saltans]